MRWLNATTACTYPQPWISRVPLPRHLPSATISADSTHLSAAAAAAERRRSWLAAAHRLYVGTYGHLLLGNFTVAFRPTNNTHDGGTLLFQVHAPSSFDCAMLY